MMAVATRNFDFHQTHFLGLPLFNSRSKSQLESFTHRLRNDDYAEGIPQRAFSLPATFYITVADLRLDSGRDIRAALDLLRRLDIERILKESATSTATAKINEQPDNGENEIMARRSFDKPVIPPLQISLPGVERAWAENGKKSTGLYGTINEPSGLLRGFVRGVRREFISAGFRLFSGQRNNEEDYVGSKPLVYALVNGRTSRRTETFVEYTGNIVRKQRKIQYDVTALCQRYENVEIARDIIIEKLSLCKEGCKRTFRGDHNEFVADEYFEEIGSIPLPQKA